MRRTVITGVVVCLLVAGQTTATTFLVGSDADLIAKSAAIVVGQVQGSHVEQNARGIETVYDIRVDRSIKGHLFAGQMVRIYTRGGSIGDMAVLVPGNATFATGERDLLFLTDEGGRWQTVDMMIGKFRFAKTSKGERFLVRDYDDVDVYDVTGGMHSEPLRRESEFLQYVENKVRGRINAETNYLVEPSFVPEARTLRTQSTALNPETNLTFPSAVPATYSTYLTCGGCPPPTTRPMRWETFGAGISFYKNSVSGLTGAGDGGVSVIQTGLAAWNNECGSNVNYLYGGTSALLGFAIDGTNVVEFNDPRGLVGGSCGGGACVVAVTQMAINAEHTFAGVPWWSLFDTDIIFNDGYSLISSTQASMNHELGHSLGFRHSNASYNSGNDSANTCSAVDSECTTTDNSAIMFWRALNAGPTLPLMDWDRHAVEKVYAAGSCRKKDFDGDGRFDLVWRNTVTGQHALWFMNGVNPTSTIFISGTSTDWDVEAMGDLNNDGSTDLIFRNYTTGQTAVWFMNGSAINTTAFLPSVSTDWKIVGSGDFNADGFDDIVLRNTATGQNAFWYMNGSTVQSSAFFNDLPLAWSIEGAADFDGDGRPDLMLRNYTSGQSAVWYFVNSVLTSTAYILSIPPVWNVEAIGDFDGNGTVDLMYRNYSTGQNAIWFLTNNNVDSTQFMVSIGLDWRVEGVR